MGAGDAKRYYPAFLDIAGKLTVVVGSGPVAERKALQLSRYAADVTIITSSPSEGLLESQSEGTLLVEHRDYVRGDLTGAALVFCISEDPEVRQAVSAEARSVGCPVNIAGAAQLSTFLVPGVVHREPLQIAVSTGGTSPELAKQIRRRVAEMFDGTWADYAALIGGVRALASERLGDPAAVSRMVQAMLDSALLRRLNFGETPTVDSLYEEFLPASVPPEDEAAAVDTGEDAAAPAGEPDDDAPPTEAEATT